MKTNKIPKEGQRPSEKSMKDRPMTSKEYASNSISKRTERTIENFKQSSSQEKDLLSEQRPISTTLLKQNIQIKALKSLIKNKYGSIPTNFLAVFHLFYFENLYFKKNKSKYRFLRA